MSLLLAALAQYENKHYQAGLRAHSIHDVTKNLSFIRDINIAKGSGSFRPSTDSVDLNLMGSMLLRRYLGHVSHFRRRTAVRISPTLYDRDKTMRKTDWSNADDPLVHI